MGTGTIAYTSDGSRAAVKARCEPGTARNTANSYRAARHGTTACASTEEKASPSFLYYDAIVVGVFSDIHVVAD